ncbi:MAG: hypothetical protein ACK4QL_05540 [Pseudanabaenaceae cyanobacterium]
MTTQEMKQMLADILSAIVELNRSLIEERRTRAEEFERERQARQEAIAAERKAREEALEAERKAREEDRKNHQAQMAELREAQAMLVQMFAEEREQFREWRRTVNATLDRMDRFMDQVDQRLKAIEEPRQ